jgi:Tfp pilus assembly protein PilN
MFLGTTVGIEISGKDVRIAVLRTLMGKVRLLQALEISDFVSLPPDEQKASIAKLVAQHKLPAARVYLSLPRDRGVVRQIEFPLEVREKLRSAVALQLETLCPWPGDEIYWDFAEEPPKKGAKSLTATVVMIPRDALDPWIEFFKSVKLPLSGASLSSVACAHGVRALWTDDIPTIVLDCEAGYVEASLLQGNRLTSVTETAEETAGSAKAAVDRLLAVGRLSSPERTRVILYGAAAGSLESFEYVSLPIENAKRESSSRFGAIASSLAGLKKTAFDSNLLPRHLRYRQNQLQLIPTYVLIALAVLLGIAIVAREPYQTMLYASKLDSEIETIAPQIKEVSSQEAELNKLSEKYRILVSHLQARDSNLEAMREVSLSLPPGAWLSNYSYQDGAITISGFATSASEVQKALEDTALFRDVQFTTSLTRDAGGKDRFTLRGFVEVPK